MNSQEQKHSLASINLQSQATELSENAVPGQPWTTKRSKICEFKMIVMVRSWREIETSIPAIVPPAKSVAFRKSPDFSEHHFLIKTEVTEKIHSFRNIH